MTILELQEQRLNLQSELKSIMENGEAEKRELDENENSRMAEIRNSIDDIDKQIEEQEKENRKIELNNKDKETKTMEKEIRLIDLIKGVANGNLTEEQRSFVQGNKIDYRATIMAGVAGQGQENVPEEKKNLDIIIRNKSVLNKLGATWFGNACGDISIPKFWGSNVQWKGEGVAAVDGASAFTETILQPKRLTAYVDISKQFLAQDSNDAEAIIIDDLARAISEKLDKTVFGTGSGSTFEPAGIMQGAHMHSGISLTAVTYEDVLNMESRIEGKNAPEFVWVANPKVYYALKGTDRAAGFGKMVVEGNEIDGFPCIRSNSVADKGLLAIYPKDLCVATWSGVEITVDTVTRAIYNEVRLVVNYLVDAKLRGDKLEGEIFS